MKAYIPLVVGCLTIVGGLFAAAWAAIEGQPCIALAILWVISGLNIRIAP